MKIKEWIYSLLLLMVVTIGGGGLLSSQIYHCSSHNHDCKTAHHHCHHDVEECENHDIQIAHRCVVEGVAQFEYIPSNLKSVPQPLVFVEAAGVSVSCDNVLLCSGCDNDRLNTRLYNGYDPSSGLLRAPPVSMR